MLSFLFRLLVVLVVGRLIGGLVRYALGRRSNATAATPRDTAPPAMKARHVGGDIVDAEFEDVPEETSS